MIKKDFLRFGLVLGSIFLLYGILILRLFYWQVIKAEGLSKQAKAQSLETLPISAVRGQILASDGFPLAANTISYLLYSNPKLAKDKQYYGDKLGEILKIDPASISAKLNQDLFWVRLAPNLSNKQKEEIEKLKLPGLGFEKEYSRLYPEASMAAHLIGFVGRDEKGSPHGYFGVEGKYNNQASGRDGAESGFRDALRNQILMIFVMTQK